MGLLDLNMGKGNRVRIKLVISAVFLKLVRPLAFSDPACAENRVKGGGFKRVTFKTNSTVTGIYPPKESS